MKRFTLATATAVALLAAGTASASAATRAVDDDGQATPRNCDASDPASPTIQGAVDASAAGDTIVVCPGTYTEQVTVPAGQGPADAGLARAPSGDHQGAGDLERDVQPPAAGHRPRRGRRERLVRLVHDHRPAGRRPVLQRQAQRQRADPRRRLGEPRRQPHHQGQADSRRAARLPERLRRPDRPSTPRATRAPAASTTTRSTTTTRAASTSTTPARPSSPSATPCAGRTSRTTRSGVALAATNGVQISRGASAYLRAQPRGRQRVPGLRSRRARPGERHHPVRQRRRRRPRARQPRAEQRHERRPLQQRRRRVRGQLAARRAGRTTACTPTPGLRGQPVRSTTRRSATTEHDCHDDSTGRGTAGTANIWRDNRGETENRAGLCKKTKGHRKDDDD